MASDGPKSGGANPAGKGATTAAKISPTSKEMGGVHIGGDKTAGMSDKNANAAAYLGVGEAAAVNTDNLDQDDDSVSGVAEEEENVNYTGGGSDDGEIHFVSNPVKALIGMMITIAGLAAIVSASYVNPLVAWKEVLTSSSVLGGNSAVINKRSNFMMNRLLKTNYDTVSNSIFGSRFKMSTKLKNKLKAQNIDYVETTNSNGEKVKLLVYEDPDGRVTPIVASERDMSKAGNLVGTDIDIDGRKVTITDPPSTLQNARMNNESFRNNYDAGTVMFTGKIAGWFDSIADSLTNRIIGRSARKQTDIDGEITEEKVNEMLYENASQGDNESEMRLTNAEMDDDDNSKIAYDQDGDVVNKETGEKIIIVDADGNKVRFDEASTADDALKVGRNDAGTVAKNLAAKAQKVAMLGSSAACGFLRSVGVISTAVGAIQTANVIRLAAKYLELSDKVKDGKGDATTNIATNDLNKEVETTAYDGDGKEVSLFGSVLSSTGWNTPFSKVNLVDENDPAALMVNRENATTVALRNLTGVGLAANALGAIANVGGGMAAFSVCNTIQIAAGLVDAVADIVTLIATWGTGTFIKQFIKGALEGAAMTAVMTAMFTLISMITPMVASWLGTNLIGIFMGKIGGHAMLSGVQNIGSSNLQMSTGRFADEANLMEVHGLTKDVEREWAAYERSTKSPFDTSSQYTFLGSIAYSIIPITNNSSGGVITPLSTIASLAGSSIASSFSPAVSAVNDYQSLSIASSKNCAHLKDVGVVGSGYCNKYAGAYVNELSRSDPENNYRRMDSYGSFDGEDEEGNPKVNPDSDYGTWIVACVANDAQPGTISGAVEGFIEKVRKKVTGNSAIAGGVLNFAENFVPFSGFLDSLDGAQQQENFKWNSGLACTGNTGDADFDAKIKDFSMYNLDQRVLANMGLIKKNSTQAFLEEYYKENPIDYSYEGTIARFSGMTKEQVSYTLDIIDYFDYIANYDPSDRYAFTQDVKPEGVDELKFDNENKVAYVVLLNTIEFADVRNRSFVV